MAEAEYVTTAKLPVDAIWDHVREMDHWAHLVMGYQGHEKKNQDESVWTLKGDVGVLTRTLTFDVRVTDWGGPERVTFEVKGINEPMDGAGSFSIMRYEEASQPAAVEAPKKNFLLRFLERIFRFFFQRVRGKPQRDATADAGPGVGMSQLTFRLQVTPGGPMGPMVDAMIKPMMPSFAEDLAGKIIAQIEAQHGGETPAR